jgi:MYXO-CTERM domain-containing protein
VAGEPQTELCDNLDNDCDGEIDNGFYLGDPCVEGIGECRKEGTILCAPDREDSICSVQAGQVAEEICDGKDNDCDGETDNGCLPTDDDDSTVLDDDTSTIADDDSTTPVDDDDSTGLPVDDDSAVPVNDDDTAPPDDDSIFQDDDATTVDDDSLAADDDLTISEDDDSTSTSDDDTALAGSDDDPAHGDDQSGDDSSIGEEQSEIKEKDKAPAASGGCACTSGGDAKHGGILGLLVLAVMICLVLLRRPRPF